MRALNAGPSFGLAAGLVGESQWRAMAAERVLDTWSEYLRSSEGAQDAARATLENVVAVLAKAKASAAACACQNHSALGGCAHESEPLNPAMRSASATASFGTRTQWI